MPKKLQTADELLSRVQAPVLPSEQRRDSDPGSRGARIMYIERKAGRLTGEARIGRVKFSKTGRTLYYGGKKFQSLKGAGFKSNFLDLESGEAYWISGPRRDGADRLYGERVSVEIDEDVREEYWREIRGQPERANETKA